MNRIAISLVTIFSTLLFSAAWSQTVEQGQAYLDALGKEATAKASFDFTDEKERKDWSNLPGGMHPRKGLSFGEMNDAQKAASHDFLQVGLSEKGYNKAKGVMLLDDILGAKGRSSIFSSDKYWMAMFGAPHAINPWGWQLDGHHLAVNFMSVNGKSSFTPLFFGAEPEVVLEGEHKGMRVFDLERKKAFALIKSLNADQRKKAILADTVPAAIFEGPGAGGALDTMAGIVATELTDPQRQLLWNLINEYLDNAPKDIATAQRAKIIADGEAKLHFAWMGPIDDNQNVYFRIHGPSVLIEYDNVFVGRRPDRSQYSNHIHTILREPSNDFGDDLLRKHYEEHEHHRD